MTEVDREWLLARPIVDEVHVDARQECKPDIVERLQARLAPSQGKRPGRPTDVNWVHHPKIPMSKITEQRLVRLAERISDRNRKVSAMQLAAQLLEDAVARIAEE